ncbi:MAG: hypothetical protein ACFHXK_04565 [bacterium]
MDEEKDKPSYSRFKETTPATSNKLRQPPSALPPHPREPANDNNHDDDVLLSFVLGYN